MNGKKINVGLVLFCCLFFYTGSAAGEDVKIDLPMGGWRNSQDMKLLYTQEVNYPASSVNVQEDQNPSALIKGHIAARPKENKEPYTLIVNGIAMPLLVEGEAFARPYIFSYGSNNVEIRSPDRKAVSRVQFYESYTGVMQSRLRIVLTWDSDGTDLDLHVVTPDGEHCFYGNRVLSNGGALDVDVTTGYGPEIFATPSPVNGTYLMFVNYYGSGERSDDHITVAQVTVVTHEGTPDEKMQTFTVPLRAPGELTLVSTFVYP